MSTRPKGSKRKLASRSVTLTVTGVTIYLLAPSLLQVFSSWNEVAQLELRWLLLVGTGQVLAWSSVWGLQRLALRTRRWLPVITSQLAGHAASRVVPGGAAAAAALQFRLLKSAGVSTAHASVGLAAAGIIQFGTILALPIAVLPTLLFGAPVARNLQNTAYVALGLFAVLAALVTVGLLSDRPLAWIGHRVDQVRALVHRPATRSGESASVHLLHERDMFREEFGSLWQRGVLFAVSRAMLDYLSLLAAVAAFSPEPRPSLILLAFASASLLSMIPLTPGGLGFVEAGLVGTLALASVDPLNSVSAALLYRLFSFWLPIPIGLLAATVHGIRYQQKATVAP